MMRLVLSLQDAVFVVIRGVAKAQHVFLCYNRSQHFRYSIKEHNRMSRHDSIEVDATKCV